MKVKQIFTISENPQFRIDLVSTNEGRHLCYTRQKRGRPVPWILTGQNDSRIPADYPDLFRHCFLVLEQFNHICKAAEMVTHGQQFIDILKGYPIELDLQDWFYQSYSDADKTMADSAQTFVDDVKSGMYSGAAEPVFQMLNIGGKLMERRQSIPVADTQQLDYYLQHYRDAGLQAEHIRKNNQFHIYTREK